MLLSHAQRGVDWRNPANADCGRVTRTCYYDDYHYGPPDAMFTKLTAPEFDPDKSTYSSLGKMYNASWRASSDFRERYGFAAP